MSSPRGSVPRPTISVLIPVRDGAAYLAEAIESARSQSLPPDEVIVVDDGSTDASGEVAGRYRDVRYVRQDPLGISAARNCAVAFSSGDLLAFLDADDVFEDDRLRHMVEPLAKHAELEAVFGCVTEFVQAGLPDRPRAALRTPKRREPSHLITAMLIRRAAFDRIGSFSTDQDVNVTVEWYSRALAADLRSVMLDRVVLRRRLHDANVGVTRWDSGRQLVRIAQESLERRRVTDAERRNRAEER
jgi:glycosyltransferase involved in cell wall biosynthesis